MTTLLMLLLITLAFINAVVYCEGKSFLNLYACILNTAMFLVMYAVELMK
jgi:hypothetical protein